MPFNLNLLPPQYQALQSKRILIMGNGPSAAAASLGERIDGFDVVVRINNYVTEGLEDKVGSKTDIWVNGANQGLIKRKTLATNILVMIPTVVLDHKGEAIHERIKKRLGTEQYFLLPREIMAQMEDSGQLERPTTGYFCIRFFESLGLDVTLHGFDFFVGSKAHYFDSPLKRWLKDRGWLPKAGKHDVSGEKQQIETLIASGRLKTLVQAIHSGHSTSDADTQLA